MLTKEQLTEKRKQAYQAAKAKRDADPKYIALKEKLNAYRRLKYRDYKERVKREKSAARIKKRKERDEALMAMLRPASELENIKPQA